ncbi:MAG TPA: glutathione S-transferase family protein [Burkholderiales bacterium]|nr:glutathione S-transferase family protein [Burkholderiales bacterium]
MLRVYGDIYSGNCFKVKLLLSHLALPHEWVHVDILKKETRTPEFLAKNRNGKIPLIEIEPGTFLSESPAILAYLAEGTSFLPKDRLERARVLQWMSFEQYSHEPYIATARFIVRYLGRPSTLEESLQQKIAPGYRALDVMEQHLSSLAFFVAERYTIADIALYAYTHVAQEGGFDMAKYSAIDSWMARVRSQTGYVGMDG